MTNLGAIKKSLLVALLLTLGAEARAAWGDLKQGQDPRAAMEAVGAPLMMTKSRSGSHATWTYDNGAYIQLERGRVTFWQAPKAKAKAEAAAAKAVENAAATPGVVVAEAGGRVTRKA